ncbi:PREDICTED: actin cytoskeleton-regulatory complex protein PAN1-like isoform X2 [Nicrophorus vespilloides]|uniref:Actin cytoskeleton-regulatory complex protein PAN1-like isoform X2 n=1 Tax=Nicrophorus vespilloides TaxID=110193 RepID=A0ABM1MAE7_NICVS|nr:PREDICTED: actin cytoskeleton-regulatory complex protein PAN1-like isoform X2 [Nicrophorus vespilloides]
MSKKSTIEVFQTKISRNDRFAQMSHQEKLIEQKKKEIQAKLEQKQKAATTDHSARSTSSMVTGSSCASAKQAKSPVKQQVKKAFNFNTFSSDGTFMKQFKQLKEKKHHDYKDSKQKMFKWDNHDRYNSEDRSRSKWKREGLLKDGGGSRVMQKVRTTRFSDKPSQSFEPKINISSSYSSLISQSQSNYDGQSMVQDVTGQPLLKNLVAQNVQFPLSPQNSTIIAAAPLLLNVPPPQISSLQSQMVLQPPQQTMEMVDLCPTTTTTTVITTVTLPPLQGQTTDNGGTAIITVPPPCMPPTIELSSIPPPNPIQVHNIPPPEPLNTLTIPPPAPLQVQNIPPPSPIHLNEIPNPKPLDILSIPTPSEPMDGGSGGGGGGSGKPSMVEHRNPPDFIKNIPPPNKSVPPPNLNDQISSIVGQTKPVVQQQQQQQQQPPPPPPSTTSIPTCLPPPNIMPPTSMPPPQNILLAQQQQQAPQNILLGQQPPQQYMQLQSLLPPPSQLVNMQPSLLAAQSILSPPPSIGIVPPPPINMNCPPPALQQTGPMQVPPPPPPPPPPVQSAFITQMPPTMLTATATNNGQLFQLIESQTITDVNTPGSADYEAMASLGRMVAQCGQGIEDIVRQRKNQDPSLWFLFHKESAAYQQYLQMVEQFKSEMVATTTTTTVLDTSDDYRPEDIYEPEMPSDVGDLLMMTTTVTTTTTTTVVDDSRQQHHHHQGSKRRRKSRWGNNEELSLPSTGSVDLPPQPKKGGSNKAPRFSTKVTRNDPALIQYAVNAFGSTNLSEEEWCKAEDHFKINLLYQDMIRKRQEVERLQKTGLNKYEYDSDEETEGGTWEHKLREKEMVATQLWANELTRQAEGKHHIGDFLPPEEFKKFMEKSEAARDGRHVDISDYKEFKLKEDNIGFKMLQKLGWSEGQGLGSEGSGILEPVNKGCLRDSNQGLGLDQAENIATNDDEYDAYRKRMMLAYRFRPNPLNNPRRPYY